MESLLLHISWKRASNPSAMRLGSEVARLNRTKQTNSFAHKPRGAQALAPLLRGHYIAAAFSVAGIETFWRERFLTIGVDKGSFCLSEAGRRKGGEPPRKEAVRVRKSPD